MPRRVRAIATALLLPLLGACFADPTCNHECEGSVIAKCDWECTGDGKLDVDECHREYTREDCAQRPGPSGGPMTCKLAPVQSAPPTPTCIDANMPRCDPAVGMFCTGPHSAAECRATTEGGYALAPQEVCTEALGLECHPDGAGIHCVDVPKKSCDPASYPRCLDGGTLLFCLGTPAAGYFVRTASCQSAQCLGAPGAARCQQG